ncbi:MAG: dihydroorotate dehydrogenase-like protein [Deltaproteobacteria bacterium]|nr:dihydroorotate dehydrogenase-like protein [Deltaproteobacteria bacterium]
MDLSTTYLGLRLPHPLMPGASPLVDDLDQVRRLEDAGAAAIVMHSLFEEQIAREERSIHAHVDRHEATFAEALSFLPDGFPLGPDEYLEQLRKIKAMVSVPVIGSLNGTTLGGWLRYAKLIQDAGADALELNVYHVATDLSEPGSTFEARTIDMVRELKRSVRIPVAVKLSPFWSSIAHFGAQLDAAGADGIVVFNRFYQPDIDVEELEVRPTLHLSDPHELLLRLHAVAVLSRRIRPSLAVTGGVHSGLDAVKAVMCGAHAVQTVSSLLKRGAGHLATLIADLRRWLEEHEYESLAQAQGSMGLERCPDPKSYERGNYMKVLQSWGR